ncbi:hemin ABC transporter substrate-binding protein [Neomegalonema sp.]|uniref:heme/hemin ABC transporter substrate-binding protein n=1 Tax=Neomegalonema sp. TaxID=2039713 RepID=UPI00260F9AC6|nr:helical backbone metal receptor [Neomegalonema sp.]MDD2867514.1 helical backbone metal receptor [Neomegalonema sp.]
MRRKLLGLLAGVAALALGAGSAPAGAEEAAAARVVSLGGDLTEIAFALGAGGSIVAADDTATWPEAAAELPKVGYVRRFSPEGVLGLTPDLVIAAHDAGPELALERLRSAGLEVKVAPDGEGWDSVAPKIAFVGEALKRPAEAEALIEETTTHMAAVQAVLEKTDERPGVIFIMSDQRGSPMAAGRGTAADAVIALAGGRNVITEYEGYKPLSRESAAAIAPDVVLVPNHVLASMGGIEGVKARPEFAASPAAREDRILAMDAMKLLGFGPRTPEAVEELATALHPELAPELARALAAAAP